MSTTDQDPGQDNAWVKAMRQGNEETVSDMETSKRKGKGKGKDPLGGQDVLGRFSATLGRAFAKAKPEAKLERAEIKKLAGDDAKAAKDLSKDLKARGVSKAKLAPVDNLNLRATMGHVTFTAEETTAWFTVLSVSHGFNPVADIESAITGDAVAYSKLVGRRVHVRSTTRPYPVATWAKDTYDDAVAAGTPIGGFSEFLQAEQRHMQGSSFSEKWVYMGVRISTFRRYPKDPRRELAFHRETIEELGRELAGSSLRAIPASVQDMEWLIRRSVALGVPMPRIGVAADYEPSDIEALEASATWTGEPMTKHINVTARPHGMQDEVVRKVSVLTLGRLSDQQIPQESQTGWMQRTDRLGFPVEWSARFDVISPMRTQAWIRGRMDVIADQLKHYVDEHGITPPTSLKRHNAMALDIQTSLDSDHGGTAIRTAGWYRVAVAGDSEEQLKERVSKLKSVYGSRAELVETPNQYHCAREFIPGEPLATSAHVRRMSALALAAAIPQGTAEVGDRVGVTLGHTAGSAMRAVAWHTHWDMERRDTSGLMLIGGGLGSGKTFALGGIVYRSVMSGVQWNVLDPSDRLGRLCDEERLPELKGKARYINLMKGRDGELNPYRVVGDPQREHFDSDEEWERAVSDAEGTRSSLMKDILYSFLSKEGRENPDTDTVLIRAMSEVTLSRTSSATHVVEAMEQIAEGKIHTDLLPSQRIKARDLVIEYTRLAITPIGKLIFPPKGAAVLEDWEDDDILLNVYTLNGMSVPSEEIIASGNIPETARLSMSVMTLAAWLVQSRIYLGDRDRRKGLAIDEGKVLNAIDTGRMLLTKSATDSRKFNLRAIYCSQNVTHFDVGDDSENSLGNLVGAALIGDTQDLSAQRAALKVLGAPQDAGYEAILGSLRPRKRKREEVQRDLDGRMKKSIAKDDEKRHFIFSSSSSTDANRSIERIVFDLDAHPHVAAALNSRPKSYDETSGISGNEESAA